MAKYLIHAIPKRMWYVEDYLIPSMTEQGIDRNDIEVYVDINYEGNLRACMNAFASRKGIAGGTWHIQDDVCICSNFKELTEQYDDGLVCGFSSYYDEEGHIGDVKIDHMWFSFPCIRIPNDYASSCQEYADAYIIGNPVYERYWKNGVNDDWMFRTYLKNEHKGEYALNLTPNLVEHIDYLLGGGTGKKERKKPCKALYFADHDVVRRLEVQIHGR